MMLEALAGRVGLAVAHPGHELRLTGWIAAARPLVFVLAAGSRSGANCARVEASRRLADRLGAEQGPLFGRHLDRDLYRWMMAGEAGPFVDLAHELADVFAREGLSAVVTDAWQLYNPVHDLWHATVRAAAGQAGGLPVLDYAVVPPQLAARACGPTILAQRLTADEVQAKLALAAAFPDIAGDVAEVVRAGGLAFLAEESLHALRPFAELVPARGERTPFEAFGEDRVAAGVYAEVLRFRCFAPIVEALQALEAPAQIAA
jgi:hypothetical protein